MYFKGLVVFTILVCVAVSTTSADCPCGAGDLCSCARQIVRPQPLIRYDSRPVHRPCDRLTFRNFGNRCSCGDRKCQKSRLTPCGSSDQTIRAPDIYQGLQPIGGNIYNTRKVKKAPPKIPADPVSLALAYKAAERAGVSEANLQYGFRKPPKNQPHVKNTKNIDEGKLFAVDRDVVELKPPCKKDEEEAEEEEEEEEEETKPCLRPPGQLAYSDIGYFPTKYHDAKFEVQPVVSVAQASCMDPLQEHNVMEPLVYDEVESNYYDSYS